MIIVLIKIEEVLFCLYTNFSVLIVIKNMKNSAAVRLTACSARPVGKKRRKYFRFSRQGVVHRAVELPPQVAAAEVKPAAAVAEHYDLNL